MNIIFTGLPGSGKSSVGRILAEKLNLCFVDVDQEIEKADPKHRLCREIYKEDGESFFRKAESNALEKLKSSKQAVIALGGGTLLEESNRLSIARLGFVFYLKNSSGVLYERVTRNGLPAYLDRLNPQASFECLVKNREALFEQILDFQIDSQGKTVEDIASEVFVLVEKNKLLVQVN